MLGKESEKADPEATLVIIGEGYSLTNPDRVVNKETSHLGRYEDHLPKFDEEEQAIRFVHADSILEKTIRIHQHWVPDVAFATEYYHRDIHWIDYDSAVKKMGGLEKLNTLFWIGTDEWKVRKKHPYWHLVKVYNEWYHQREYPECTCEIRPHEEGLHALYCNIHAEKIHIKSVLTDREAMGDVWRIPFCGVVEKCVLHNIRNCYECISNDMESTLEYWCPNEGQIFHLSSFQGVIGKFLNRLPDMVWGWSDASSKFCDKHYKEGEWFGEEES